MSTLGRRTLVSIHTGPVATRWRAHPGLGRAYALVTANTLANGVLMLLGGSNRVSARAFAVLRSVGNWPTWGCVLVASALLTLTAALSGRLPVLRAALILGAVIDGLLAFWFLTAGLNDPLASFAGAVNFSTLCLWHLSQQDECRRDAA